MSRIYAKEISFSMLKRNFQDGVYAIPQLQRNYVWDKSRVCLLLDSIYHHYPIGVSLVWNAKSSKVAEIKPNNKTILPPFNVNSRTIDFLIDGQQRLTSIYGIIEGIHEAIDFNSKIDFRNIYFALDREKETRFVYLRRYDATRGEYIPVHHVVKDNPQRLKRKFNLTNAAMREVEKLKSRIQSYKFHFIYVETDSIDEVRETFVRINSQGMTVSKADAMFARAANIGLRDLVDGTRRALMKREYHEMKPEAFIYTMALSKGERSVGKKALNNFTRKFNKQEQFKARFQREWRQYHKAFLLASDFMEDEFLINSYYMLPSDNIFTMLSLFFYLNHARPSPHQIREIRKWFWHTTLGERYSGSAFNKNIPLDIDFFKKLANRQYHTYTIGDKINANDFLKKDYRKTNFSAVMGYYLFLKSQGPRYLQTGTPMMLDNALALANRKDRHHIFPQGILDRRRIKTRWKHALLNICFLAANENQSISDDLPREYLGAFKRKRYFRGVMKSHLIPVQKNSGVWNKSVKEGFKLFLNQRANLLLNGIADVAGVHKGRLFERFDDIRRL